MTLGFSRRPSRNPVGRWADGGKRMFEPQRLGIDTDERAGALVGLYGGGAT